MLKVVSDIWKCDPDDFKCSLDQTMNESLEKISRGKVFFRADDIAAPSKNFTQMMELFKKYQTPLCLAVTPSWISRPRWQALLEAAGDEPSLWCWHQHGWRHINHEPEGKKQEFGPSRTKEAIARDLALGKERLEQILGPRFFPFFTPPWNRCSAHTLALLQSMGYNGISRSIGAKPKSQGLPDIFVNVDLHTRREKDGKKDLTLFFQELSRALSSGYCGVMIHHQLMNDAAFEALEALLQAFCADKKLELGAFDSLGLN